MGTDGEVVRRVIGTTCSYACATQAELTRLGSNVMRISNIMLCVRSRRAMTASSLPLRWDVVRLHHRERCAQKLGPIAGSKLCTRDARRELYDIFCNFVGSVLSPLLANIALDGLAKRLGKGYRMARYADDIVVMAKSLPAMEQACTVVTAFLKERGLVLHPEKTRIVQRTEGFDFLGFHVQMRGQKLLITPQQQKVQALLRDVRSWLRHHQTVSPEAVVRHLNPLLRGWAMYYRHVVSKHAFQQVDYHIWRALWRWAKRRHPRKPKRWIYRRYFEVGKYGATFYAESRDRRGQTIRLRLERVPAIPIVRHVKVKGCASLDDPTLKAYWDRRRLKMGRQQVTKGSLLYGIAEAQRWQCPGCGHALFDGQEVHLHHRIPVHAGGRDARANLQGLHAACHHQRHQQGITAGQSA
jgi:RNA-directed DNA polymerase